MQRWEYWCDSTGNCYDDYNRQKWLDSLGEEGWELVSEVVVDDRIRCTFKRPRVAE
jgi:hypothetical protein